VDFQVAFADVQQMQGIRQKLHKCRAVLDTSLEIAEDHESLLKELVRDATVNGTSQLRLFEESLGMYKTRLRNHRRGVDTLLDLSVGVFKIVSSSMVL
jgi:hypothetical protein